MLNILTIINIIFGFLLSIFILFNKNSLGKNNIVRFSLVSVVLIYTLASIGEYIYASVENTRYNVIIFLAIITFHLIGYFLYLFISNITDNKLNIKKYTVFILLYTVIRIVLYFYIENLIINIETNNEIQNFTNFNYKLYVGLIQTDEITTYILNIFLIIKSYLLFKNTPLIIEYNTKKEIYSRWIYIVLLINLIIFILLIFNTIILFFDRNYLNFVLEIETYLYFTFYIVLTLSIMYFPVFAITGKYEDLPESIIKKYEKSSLTDSKKLFEQIDEIVKEQKLYLDPELKMNKIAEALDKSIPYISQAINENIKKSFPDYINSFRIQEAKEKLLIDKPDTIFAIAIDVGFNSKVTFYNAFKKVTNDTPTNFRKKTLDL